VERLPSGILARHRAYERAESSIYLRPWSGGRGAVCGRHQVSVTDITSPDGEGRCRDAQSPVAAQGIAARMLADSRKYCAKSGKCLCPFERYNPGDAAGICAALGCEM